MEHREELRVRDVAQARLGLSEARVRELVRAGIVPHVRKGRRIVILRAAFEKWLASRAAESLRGVRRERRRTAEAADLACTR